MTDWTHHLSYPVVSRPPADPDELRDLAELLDALEPDPASDELEEAGPRTPRTTPLRRVLQVAVGFGLIALGLVGLIFPVMPGWIFIFIGLPIVSASFPPLRRLIGRLLRRRTVQRAIDSAARGATSRAAMIKALQSDLVRRGLDHSTRSLVLKQLIDATIESDTAEGDHDDR